MNNNTMIASKKKRSTIIEAITVDNGTLSLREYRIGRINSPPLGITLFTAYPIMTAENIFRSDGFSTTGESMVFHRRARSQWETSMTGMERSTHSYRAFNNVENRMSRLMFLKAIYDEPMTMASVIAMRTMCFRLMFMNARYGIDDYFKRVFSALPV